MTGTTKRMIDRIMAERAQGNRTLELTTRTKLILKGFNPDKFAATSPDNPVLIQKLATIAQEMGVNLGSF